MALDLLSLLCTFETSTNVSNVLRFTFFFRRAKRFITFFLNIATTALNQGCHLTNFIDKFRDSGCFSQPLAVKMMWPKKHKLAEFDSK